MYFVILGGICFVCFSCFSQTKLLNSISKTRLSILRKVFLFSRKRLPKSVNFFLSVSFNLDQDLLVELVIYLHWLLMHFVCLWKFLVRLLQLLAVAAHMIDEIEANLQPKPQACGLSMDNQISPYYSVPQQG